ncbi:hypothetical protein SNE40_020430 [Patella caerulea]|uniref:ABC transporter domain-containing protein n=1 Tax=Patella caerulea TaxID=87958 RepID=A0AAN8GHQ4_PATCE
MGVFQQLKLLFKKNYILRKRQPGILALEVLWPVFMVIIVAVIRQAVPPEERHTCHYQERAMPSAGMVPFLQTFVCNLENKCNDEDQLRSAQEVSYKVSSLVGKLAPYIGSDDTVSALDAMDNGVKLLDTLNKVLVNNSIIDELEKSLKVRNLFKDEERVKQILITEYGVASETVVDAILNSTLNITGVFNLLGYSDLKTTVCTPSELKMFLVFPDDVNITDVSRDLCAIDVDKIPQLTQYLQEQLDIAEIVRLMGLFEKFKEIFDSDYKYPVSQGFNDVADMMDLVFKSPSLLKAIESMSTLKNIPDIIRKMPKWIKMFESTKDSLKPISELVTMLDPILEQIDPNNMIWRSIKSGVKMVNGLVAVVDRKYNGSSNDLMQTINEFLTDVETTLDNISPDATMILQSLSSIKLGNIFEQSVAGTLSDKKVADSLNELQETLEKTSIWNITGPAISLFDKVINMFNLTIHQTQGLEEAVQELVGTDGSLQTSINQLLSKGPNVTKAVLDAFTDSKLLAKMFEQSFSYSSMCDGVIQKVRTEMGDNAATELNGVLCNADTSEAVQNFLSSLNLDKITLVMNETVQLVEYLVNDNMGQYHQVSLSTLYMSIKEFVETSMKFIHSTKWTWGDMFSGFKTTGIDLHRREWYPVIDMMNENYVGTSIVAMARAFGEAMYKSPLVEPVSQYVHMAEMLVEYGYNHMKISADTYATDSTMGQLVQFVTEYSPEIAGAAMNMLEKPEVMYELIESDNPYETVCSDNWMDKMNVPYYVPMAKIEDLICKTDWNIMIQNLVYINMGGTDQLTKDISVALDMMSKGERGNYNMTMDWIHLMDYTERSVDMFTDEKKRNAFLMGTGNWLQVFNMTQVEQAFQLMMNKLEGLTMNDVARGADIGVFAMKQIDNYYENATWWNNMKRYVLSTKAYLNLLNSYYDGPESFNTLQGMLKHYPESVRDIVTKSVELAPYLVRALKDTIIFPERLLRMLNSGDYKVPDCRVNFLSDYMVDTDNKLRQYEQFICAVNFTAIEEDYNVDPDTQEFMNALQDIYHGNISVSSSVYVNWTELALATDKYIEFTWKVVEDVYYNSNFNWLPLNISALDMSWSEFVQAMDLFQRMPADRLSNIMNEVQQLASSLGFMAFNNTEFGSIIGGQMYMSKVVLTFGVQQLQYFNSTSDVYLLQYMGSDELTKLFSRVEKSPEILKIGLDTFSDLFANPHKLAYVTDPDRMQELCTNVDVITTVFNFDPSVMSPASLQKFLCEYNWNFTLILDEFTENWPGFKTLREEIEAFIQNPAAIPAGLKASEILRLNNEFSLLLTSLITNPPNFHIFNSNDWMNMTIYEQEYNQFVEDLNATMLKFTDPNFMVDWELTINSIMYNNVFKNEWFNTVLYYIDAILDINANLSTVSVQEEFRNYPTMSKVISLVDQIPEALEVYIYTSLTNPEKLIEMYVGDWNNFCDNPSRYFETPEELNFNATVFLNEACMVNLTQLETEASNIEWFNVSPNMTYKHVNVTKMAQKLIKLYLKARNSPNFGLNLRLFDQNVYKTMVKRVERYLNQSANFFMTPESIFKVVGHIYTTSTSGVRQVLAWLPTTLAVVDNIMDKIIALENKTSFNLADIFKDSPQLQFLVNFIQKPGVIEVLLDSVNSQKFIPLMSIQNATEALMLVCDPRTDMKTYLVSPPGVDVNMLRNEFCQINVNDLVTESNAEFDIEHITMVAEDKTNIDWMKMGEKYMKISQLLNRWIETPPTVLVPTEWQNGTFWLNMLERYNQMQTSPEAINEEIKSFLAKLSPLMNNEGFRQFGLVLENLMRLMNENFVGLQNQTLTVSNMLYRIPVLRDVMAATGITGDVLGAILTAPVKDPENFLRTIMQATYNETLCGKKSMWHTILELPESFDTSPLYNAVCNHSNTEILSNLIANLDVENLIHSFSNTTATPDWESIFKQSEELGKNIQNFIRFMPKFDASETGDLLTRSYNETNLWNMLSVYSTFGQYFPIAESNIIMRSGTVVMDFLNDIMNKLDVRGSTLDLASLFKGSQTFMRIVDTMLDLTPDPVTALLGVRLRLSKNIEFGKLATEPMKLNEVFCNKAKFLEYFEVPASFNVTVVIQGMCNINFTAIAEELQHEFPINDLIQKFSTLGNTSAPFNLQQYIDSSQRFTQRIMEFINITDVTFDNRDLEKIFTINTTALMKLWEQAQTDTEIIPSQLINDLFKENMNVSGWREAMTVLHLVDSYLKDMNQNLRNIKNQPLSLELLFNGTDLGPTLMTVLLEPEWLEELVQIHFRPDALLELIHNGSHAELCGRKFWDAFILPDDNKGILQRLQNKICQANITIMTWANVALQIQGLQFYNEAILIQRQLESGQGAMVNITELDVDMREMIKLVGEVIQAYTSGNQTVGQFVNAKGFQTVFNKFHGELGQKLMNMTSTWSLELSSLLYKQMEELDPATRRSIKTMNIFLKMINARLIDIRDGGISFSTLLGHSQQLITTVDAFISLSKYKTETWTSGVIDFNHLAEMFINSTLLKTKCDDGSVSDYISNGTTSSSLITDLQRLVCTFPSLPAALKQVIDYEAIGTELMNTWNMSIEVESVYDNYTRNSLLLSQLITQLSQKTLTIDPKLQQTFSAENILKTLENVFMNPTFIFNIMKSYGPEIQGVLGEIKDFSPSIATLNNFFVLPMTHMLEKLEEHGITIDGLLSDPSKLLSAIEILSTYDMQLILNTDTTLQLMINPLTNSAVVVRTLLCNKTSLRSVIGDLNIPNFDAVQQLLCNKPASFWIEDLRKMGVDTQLIYNMGMKLISVQYDYACYETVESVNGYNYTSFSCSSGSRLDSHFTWPRFVAGVEKLTNLMMVKGSDISNLWSSPNASSALIWKILRNVLLETPIKGALNTFRFNDILGGKSIAELIYSFQGFLNKYMELFIDSPNPILLKDVLPNNMQVEKLLEQILSPETAAEFLTMAVDPQKFLSLAYVSNWENIVCNLTEFNETFMDLSSSGIAVEAIQIALCDVATNKSNALQQFVHLFDAGDILEKINAFMKDDKHTMNNDTTIWERLRVESERLLNNFEKLGDVSVDPNSVSSWFSPILTMLSTRANNPSIDGVSKMCNSMISYVSGSKDYQAIQPSLLMVVDYMKSIVTPMTIFADLEDITCDLSNNFDLSQTFNRLNQLKFFDLFKMMYSGNRTFQCDDAISAVMNVYDTLNKTISHGININRIGHCLSNGAVDHFGTLLKSVDSVFELSTEMLTLIQQTEMKTLLADIYPDLQPILDYVLKTLSQQKSLVYKFEDLFINSTTLTDFFINSLKFAPEVVETLLKSTINLDPKRFSNESIDDIQSQICNSVELSKLIQLPAFAQIDFAKLSNGLCKNGSIDAAVGIKSVADFSNLAQQLVKLSSSDIDEAWLKNISDHTVTLIGDLEEISSVASLLGGGLDLQALQRDIPKLDKFLIGSGPARLVLSLSAILDDLKYVFPNNDSRNILGEISMFIRGFMGLDVIQSRVLSAVHVGDLLKDPKEVRNYMVKELGFTEEMAETILSGSYSLRVFLNVTVEMMDGEYSCDKIFKEFIILNSQQVRNIDITSAFCSLNKTTATSLAERLLPELDIGEWVKMYVTTSANEILKSANISMEEAAGMTTKLSKAQTSLLKAADILKDSNDTLEKDMMDQLFNLPSAQTANQMPSLQPLFCGVKADDGEVKDSLDVSSVVGGKAPEIRKDELDSLPSEFCRDIYREIMQKSIGSIIWSYLKPILRGKILFTPDTPLTRDIIKGADGMFNQLKDVRRVAQAWVHGTPSLKTLTIQAKDMSKLKDSLDNNFIKSMLKNTAGINPDSLLDGLGALDSDQITVEQLNGLQRAAQLVLNYTECIELERFIGVDSEQELLKMSKKLSEKHQFLAGVVFTNIKPSNRKKRAAVDEIPKHIIYKIRMDVDNVQDTLINKARLWKPGPEDSFANRLRYLRGFIQLQDMIERSIVSIQTGDNTTDPGVQLKQIPYPCHKDDEYIHYLGSYLLPVLMTFAWVASLGIATRNLVNDREDGQDEVLRIMGMKCGLNWVAWFLSTMIIMMIVSIILAIILKFSTIFSYSNLFIIFLYLLAFCLSSTMLCYMVSAFFTRTTLAILTVLIIYFLSYLPYIVLVSMGLQMEFWQKTVACLSSTTAFSFGAQYLAFLEELGDGIQWNNINDSLVQGDKMTFNWTCIMMLIDSLIYLVIGWYVRNVKPGKYGVAKPFYFFLQPSYWFFCISKSASSNKYLSDRSSKNQNSSFIEEASGDEYVGISTHNLRKVYNKTTAVNNLNLEFYEDHVTALLGHNGAAKTTTMNMITGVTRPTSGHVEIYNKSPADSTGTIGICPQHNALFDYMTAEEHMEFYAGVKSGNVSKEEIKRLLQDVDLWHVRDIPGKKLSGGMQRRLCVALAFVGESRAIVLDEPTSGVDPYARKSIWNLILKQKIGRTILVSTHHLDEADLLGDKIAIMHTGNLLCAGSPVFLKSCIGSGLSLTMEKKVASPSTSASEPQVMCKTSDVTEFIQQYHPQARLIEEVGTEMHYKLPKISTGNTSWAQFFDELDKRQEQLNVSSYGVSDTTLEEVFLKVTTLVDNGQEINSRTLQDDLVGKRLRSGTESTDGDTTSQGSSDSTLLSMGKNQLKSGFSLSVQQYGALLLKRFHHCRRDWRMIVSALILPVLFFLAGVGFSAMKPDNQNMPSKIMTPALYGPDTYMFFKDGIQNAFSEKLTRTLIDSPGVGTTCMNGFRPEGFTCLSPDELSNVFVSSNKTLPSCKCENYKQICDGKTDVLPPGELTMQSDDELQKLDGYNVNNYLLNTFHKFVEKRYGGWTFDKSNDGDETVTVWFNNKGYHAMPSFRNAYSNMLLRSKISGNKADYGITLYNHPLPLTAAPLTAESMAANAADSGIAIVVLMAFSFIPSALILLSIAERLNNEKQIQSISGVGPCVYWLAAFTWDMFIYLISVGLAVAIVALIHHTTGNPEALYIRSNLGAFAVLLSLFGWAIIPIMYSTLRLFKSGSAAYLVLFCVNMFIGAITVVTVLCLFLFHDQYAVERALEVVKHVFLIFPQYCLCQGLIDLTTNTVKYSIFLRFGDDVYKDPFSFEMLAYNMIALTLQGLVFFILTLIIEIKRNTSDRVPHGMLSDYTKEEDVDMEARRIEQNQDDDVLVVNKLSKVFRSGFRKILAVDNVSFGVHRGECFGLLGINGAGKTTTFRMLTGDLNPSKGFALLNGERLCGSNSKDSVKRDIGYCPQYAGLDDYLTAEELLLCYARLKGLSGQLARNAVKDLISRLGLREYCKKPIKTYSGGNKRKVSLAVAMIGDPDILILDEPTTGMDPATRRLAWKTISKATRSGQSVVLTSHSMDECDHLCARLAIMVNGQLKCLGSPQHLKNKFGDGYIVTIRFTSLSSNKAALEGEFISRFPNTVIKEETPEVVEINIPRGSGSVAEIFDLLEAAQINNQIFDYSISQTTLDEVFVNFAKDQTDSNNDEDSSSSGSSAEGSSKPGKFMNTANYAYTNPGYGGISSLNGTKEQMYMDRFIESGDAYSTKM